MKIQLNIVLVFPSAFVSHQAVARAIRRVAGAKLKITFEREFIVCKASSPVELASKLGGIFGVDRVAIAKRVKNEFQELSDTIAEIGLKAVLPGEKFFVKVKADGTKDYVSRDAEFASSGKLTARLAQIGAHPAKNEQEADRIILAFAGRKFAYVCIQVNKGPGGLPFGSLGRVLCSLHNPLSFLSCYAAAKSGFMFEIVLLYSDEGERQANAKLVEILATKMGIKEHVIRTAPICIPSIKDTAIVGLAKEAIAAQVLISQPDDRIAFPFTATIHPLWFIESMVGKAMAAGKIPYMPLMFTSEVYQGLAKMRAAKSEFQKYNSTIDAATKLSIKRMERLKLKVGPDYLHDILDSI